MVRDRSRRLGAEWGAHFEVFVNRLQLHVARCRQPDLCHERRNVCVLLGRKRAQQNSGSALPEFSECIH